MCKTYIIYLFLCLSLSLSYLSIHLEKRVKIINQNVNGAYNWVLGYKGIVNLYFLLYTFISISKCIVNILPW